MSGSVWTAVTAIGGFSPLGPTWVQTCASIRAGLTRFADHPYHELRTADAGWDEADPLRCSAVPGWEETLDEPGRVTALALEALRDLAGRIPLRRPELAAGGLLLALPGDRDLPGGRDPRAGVIPQLLARSGLDGLAFAEARDGGHAAVFLALQEAAAKVRAGELEFCIVGGVDSHLLDARIDALDAAWRLRSTRNPDGFLPGEAAVLLLLGSPRHTRAAGLAPLCLVGDTGVGREPDTIAGERAPSGAGLAAAISAALAAAPAPGWVLCDLNGESYRAFEWGLLQARLADQLAGVRRLTHPADALGDVGTATGALLVACAAHGFARGPAPAVPALLWAGSDDGTRAAVAVTPPPAARR